MRNLLRAIIPPTTSIFPIRVWMKHRSSPKVVADGVVVPDHFPMLSIDALFGCK
jgi:hypothetical protein